MINEQTFKTVFHDYLDFLDGIDKAAEQYVERGQSTQPNLERRTPLKLKIVSEKKGEAEGVQQCVRGLVVGHDVLTEFTESFPEAVYEMDQYTRGYTSRQKTLYVLMLDGEDLPLLPDIIKAEENSYNAVCFVRVKQKVMRNGAWYVPTEWLKALVKLKGCIHFGFYFMLESLNYPLFPNDAVKSQAAYEKAVAAALVTISEVFNVDRDDLPSLPNAFSGVESGENRIAVASVYSLNVTRIGILLTCARNIKKKLDSSNTDTHGIKTERRLDQVFHPDAFRVIVDKINTDVLNAVNEETAISQMASMPLDSGCEERISDALASWNNASRWLCFGKKRNAHKSTLDELLHITSEDTRFDDYYKEKVLGVWIDAIEDWFCDDQNLYTLFRDMINCFEDLTSARAWFKGAVESVRATYIQEQTEKQGENESHPIPVSSVMYHGESSVRQAAVNYVKIAFDMKMRQDKAILYIKILEKILSPGIMGKFDEVIIWLINKSTEVANRIWPSLNDEINGFRDNQNTRSDSLSRIGELYYENVGNSGQRPLDIPDIFGFLPNKDNIVDMRETLANEAVNDTVRIECCGLHPTLDGTWDIKGSTSLRPVESYENGAICFVIRKSGKHQYYESFDEQDVIRVNINLYSLQGFFDKLEDNGGTEQ